MVYGLLFLCFNLYVLFQLFPVLHRHVDTMYTSITDTDTPTIHGNTECFFSHYNSKRLGLFCLILLYFCIQMFAILLSMRINLKYDIYERTYVELGTQWNISHRNSAYFRNAYTLLRFFRLWSFSLNNSCKVL